MKTFVDRLQEMPMEALQDMIKRQKENIEIAIKALEVMQQVFDDRIYAQAHPTE